MELVNVTYRCKPGMRGEFLERILAEGIDVACRGEDGNLKYAYYLPFDDEGDDLFLVELWRDPESLAAHGKMAHYQRLGELKAEYVEETILVKGHVPEA